MNYYKQLEQYSQAHQNLVEFFDQLESSEKTEMVIDLFLPHLTEEAAKAILQMECNN